MTYTSQYPPEQSDTYVKATSNYTIEYYPYFATDPTKSLTGSTENNSWFATVTGNQRFHIDLGSGYIINRIYYENYYNVTGGDTAGAKNFTFWGSNTESAFLELTYGVDTNWTELTLNSTQFVKHVQADQADPHYIYVTNSTSYRYYAIKIADNWDYPSGTGIRRIELQKIGNFIPKIIWF